MTVKRKQPGTGPSGGRGCLSNPTGAYAQLSSHHQMTPLIYQLVKSSGARFSIRQPANF